MMIQSRVMTSLAVLVLASSATVVSAQEKTQDSRPADRKQLEFFEKQVQPILTAKCYKCHGPKGKAKGNLRLISRKLILKGGELGPAVMLNKPAESNLLQAINYDGLEMPPNGKLPQKQIDVLTQWVKLGLPMTDGVQTVPATTEKIHPPEVNDETKSHWSFQRVKLPSIPQVSKQGWVRNSIDAFILAKLEAKGLSVSGPADKVALLRRMYYDLIGLPPSPAEVRAFLADNSPQAFERVIDRLLDSPQYGEKWARYWLDLVRYAETNSFERDGAKPFVWKYRDYVIQSLNDDKPYDRFLIEQLAGDELDEVTPESIIATGYYRLGQWDDEPADPKLALYDDLDDILATTSQVMLGLTINCARCHSHKLDPIPHREYYSMLSFFRNVRRYGVRSHKTVLDRSVRMLVSSDKQKEHEKEIAEHKRKVSDTKNELRKIEDLVRKDFAGVEVEDFQYEMNRVALVKKRVGKVLTQGQFDRYVELTELRDRLRKFKPPALGQALCVKEHGRKAPATHILIRGNPAAEGPVVEPAFLSVLSPPKPNIVPPQNGAQSCGRRLALAKWIANKDNPLTARVIVNRIWQHHFGQGIVQSPNNFGLQGRPPTHPKLLDWLATELVKRGWRLKSLHKLIMMSNAYQMSSGGNTKALAQDPQNNLIWRFNMRRLTAEELRDSILAVNGALNIEKMFGPSIYPIIPREVLHGQSRPGAGWGKSSPADRNRRSIYIHIKRSLIVPMMANFDVADADFTCPVRFETTQPTQALGMLNSAFIDREATVFANFLKANAKSDLKSQVRLALRRATQREPSTREVDMGVGLINVLQADSKISENDALKYFCVVALNLNEFIYLD